MRISLIIAAGGSSSRFRKSYVGAALRGRPLDSQGAHIGAQGAHMGAPLHKLFLPLGGKPVLAHSLGTFQKIPLIREIIIAHPRGAQRDFKKLISDFKFKKIKLIAGGKTRAQSVRNALEESNPTSDWIMVHDGARPFVTEENINGLINHQNNNHIAGVILAKRVIPTIKETGSDDRIQRTLDRSLLCEAETPQLMRRQKLVEAYKKNPQALQATDEAALLESLGEPVKVVTHESWNPKITTPQDLQLAEAYLKSCMAHGARGMEMPCSMLYAPCRVRTGLGRDTHRLVAGRKFYLGGVRIPFHKGPLGHSDGDALIHAICDAILGALGAGDIGDWFSDKNKKFKNRRSEKMLKEILREAQKRQFQLQHVDTVIILEEPKLGWWKEKIRLNLARILSLPKQGISIKAKTAEGLGPEGEGLALTCEAIVTICRGGPAWPPCSRQGTGRTHGCAPTQGPL